MPKLRLIFKKHGEQTKRNLEVPEGLSAEQQWKLSNKVTKERWPELQGTLQSLEKR